MKRSDVITQLQNVLPKYTDLFSDSISISSLTLSGTTATAVCSAAHNLTTGAQVLIKGATVKNSLIVLTAAGGVASATCAATHDLIFDENNNTYVTISGATESKYNGVHLLLSVPSGTEFTFAVDSDTPATATGSPVIEEMRAGAYNGRHAVTVVDSTAFRFTMTAGFASPAGGTITAKANFRITGSAIIESAENIYTQTDAGKAYLFVLNGKSTASQNREIRNDAVNMADPNNGFFQLGIFEIPIAIAYPATDELAARKAADAMTEVRYALFKALLGRKIATGLTYDTFGISYSSDDMVKFDGAVYWHLFTFEMPFQVTIDDIADDNDTVAARSFQLTDETQPRTIEGTLP